MIRFIIGFLAMVLLIFGSFTAKVEVYNNIEQYNDFFGIEAKEEYRNKWDMDESIFDAKMDNAYQKEMLKVSK